MQPAPLRRLEQRERPGLPQPVASNACTNGPGAPSMLFSDTIAQRLGRIPFDPLASGPSHLDEQPT